MPSDQRPRDDLPRASRIRARADFERVFQQRRRASDRVMILYLGRGRPDLTRIGIAVSRRLGNAVTRNRVKRLVREAFRRFQHSLPPGTDWIVVPVNADASGRQIAASLANLSGKLLETPSQAR